MDEGLLWAIKLLDQAEPLHMGEIILLPKFIVVTNGS